MFNMTSGQTQWARSISVSSSLTLSDDAAVVAENGTIYTSNYFYDSWSYEGLLTLFDQDDGSVLENSKHIVIPYSLTGMFKLELRDNTLYLSSYFYNLDTYFFSGSLVVLNMTESSIRDFVFNE